MAKKKRYTRESGGGVQIGDEFGRLRVEGWQFKVEGRWNATCKCECGEHVVVGIAEIRSGNTKSCGCLRREVTAERSTTHGHRYTRLHNVWNGMKNRCLNKGDRRYEDYGGRGIEICPEWADSFKEFMDWAHANGYSPELTIDRKNNDGNYCPENCRWVDQEEQQSNKRTSRILEFRGRKQTLTRWAREFGINVSSLHGRLKSGWTIEDALTMPKGHKPGIHLWKYKGSENTVAGWSREIGMREDTLRNRLKFGWTLAEALETPVGQRRKCRPITKN